ncbi:hypothetical protein HELRODRAFT_178747 [Helobdella robusta]|uniref:Uncharacterized protein n=1 Tax=Helobdella robusta TaxID=6412 RepID=T1FDN7_HELRO|nr:hypothetical protein HELRODRAFT_178747 [Helobdella robusta]ESN96947.1 hypothetical protein HELRODRAFT_178747 [Helobdella robusta]
MEVEGLLLHTPSGLVRVNSHNGTYQHWLEFHWQDYAIAGRTGTILIERKQMYRVNWSWNIVSVTEFFKQPDGKTSECEQEIEYNLDKEIGFEFVEVVHIEKQMNIEIATMLKVVCHEVFGRYMR